MNYKTACKILHLDEDKKHDIHIIKKSYHALALMYHPDKNNDVDAEHVFKEVNEAYQYLQEGQKDPYDVFLDFVTSSLVMEKVFCACETHSIGIIQSLESSKFIIIYKLFKKYRHLFQFSQEFDKFMETRYIYWFSQGSLKERHKKDGHLSENTSPPTSSLTHTEDDDNNNNETMILRPVLEDVIIDNVYKYTYHGSVLLIPLWHHEIEYDISGDFVVKIIPKLPSINYWIDENNNLHQKIEYTITELWDCAVENKFMEIFFGKKRFIFYPHDLQLKSYQTWTWKMEGISCINHNNIFDVSRRADVVLHIYILGIQ